jgi:hypothetical protein
VIALAQVLIDLLSHTIRQVAIHIVQQRPADFVAGKFYGM